MPATQIFITGATGYIGAQLALGLVDRFGAGVRCRVAVRPGSDSRFLTGTPVELVSADILDPMAMLDAVAGSDVVFHCAGLIAYTGSFRERLYETNVLGTRNVVNACLAGRVGRLVATSSIAAVGSPHSAGMAESDEQSSFGEWQRRNPYMESKHLAELECLRGAAEGLDVVMVNPGVVIGKGAAAGMPGSSSNRVLRMIYDGRLPLCPQGGTGFVDVRDVVDAHIAAWRDGASGSRYIIVGANLAFSELFQRIAAMPGSRTGRPFRVSGAAGAIAGVAGELWSLATGRPTFISIESLRQASSIAAYSNARSIRELGISYRPFDDTLSNAIR